MSMPDKKKKNGRESQCEKNQEKGNSTKQNRKITFNTFYKLHLIHNCMKEKKTYR